MNKNPTQQHQAEAMTALHATQGHNTPVGNTPSDEELALMVDNKLDFKRRQEIMSHLNASENLFAHWAQLVEAQHTLSETIETKLSLIQHLQAWLTPIRMGVIGTALASVTTVAIILPLLEQPTSIVPQQTPISTPDYASQGSVKIETAIRAGIVLTYHSYGEDTRNSLPLSHSLIKQTSPEQSTLITLNSMAIQLGETLLESYRICQQKSDEQTIQKQNQLSELFKALQLANGPVTDNKVAYCAWVEKEIIHWIE